MIPLTRIGKLASLCCFTDIIDIKYGNTVFCQLAQAQLVFTFHKVLVSVKYPTQSMLKSNYVKHFRQKHFIIQTGNDPK